MTEDEMGQVAEIRDGLIELLLGKNKRLALTATLSIAATTAHMLEIPKLDAYAIFSRCYDRRVKEKSM